METPALLAKISFTARMLGGAQEIGCPNIEKLPYLRVNYYHVSGTHLGYEKCGPAQSHFDAWDDTDGKRDAVPEDRYPVHDRRSLWRRVRRAG